MNDRLRKETKLCRATLAWGSLIWSFHCMASESLIAQRKSLATDSNRKSLFQASPVSNSKISQPSVAEVFFSRKSRSSTLTTKNGDNETKVSSSRKTESYGVGYGKDLGSGLFMSASHQRHFISTSNQRGNANQGKTESFFEKLSEVRTTVQITDNLDLGVMLRWLSLENHVFGSFNVPSKTDFASSLFGSGAGFLMRLDVPSKILLFGSILNPMRGKTTFANEELLISEPGMIDIGISSNAGTGKAGISWTRYLYKRDERYLDIVSPTNVNAKISGVGLDSEVSSLFLLSSLNFAYDHQLATNSKVLFGLIKDEIEFNPSPLTKAPGSDENSPRMSQWRFHIGIESLLAFANVGSRYVYCSPDSTFSGNGRITYVKSSGDFQVYLSKPI